MEHRRMKLRFVCLWIVLVALGFWTIAPAIAEETEKLAPGPEVQAAPDAELDFTEPAPMTPAESEDLAIEDLEIRVDPSRGLLVKQIRACEPEEEILCPPECACIFVRNAVECVCP